MNRSARFEIVRTDAGWHARFRSSNGQIIFTSEVYARRRGAERAVMIFARTFWSSAVWGGMPFKVCVDSHTTTGIEVREVDER